MLQRMPEAEVAAWPRSEYRPSCERTRICLVCFGVAPLSDVPLSRTRFGLPDRNLASQLDVREYARNAYPEWFAGWWSDALGVYARQDLGPAFERLMKCDLCQTLQLEVADTPDLTPLQTAWGMARWLCERGALFVLDVYACRFHERQLLLSYPLEALAVERELKLVFETEASEHGLHLLHTRGMCKFARQELLAYVRPEDAELAGALLNQCAQRLIAGALIEDLKLSIAEDTALVARPYENRPLLEALGLHSAALLARDDGQPLAGIAGAAEPR
jgi:hypothetical protein